MKAKKQKHVEKIMNKEPKELTTQELFNQIISKLEKQEIYWKVEGLDVYLEENSGVIPRVLIKIGQLDCFIERYQTTWNKRWKEQQKGKDASQNNHE